MLISMVVPSVAQNLPEAPREKFLTPRNITLIAAAGAGIAADGFTTQHFMQWPTKFREGNPLLRPFGNSRAASVGICATGFAATVGGMYIAHRHGWKKMVWLIPVVTTGVEAAWSIHNARLSYHVPPPHYTALPGIVTKF